ncbi:uncharacterized protein LOC115926629 [Strongylocentrotus purpuratus]|uniref:Uncharacterized protein n=1 Tax=Strongylocentrotus purpuratus TaxID=7668 RepID=A0A7M7P7A1_STRPU|nr:uncharacterized protein LOC115926629 [Strongylocentrotus purpuratus]
MCFETFVHVSILHETELFIFTDLGTRHVDIFTITNFVEVIFKMPGNCHFKDAWLEHPDYRGWILKESSDLGTARCAVCMCKFSVRNMGEAAVKSHKKSEKHTANLQQQQRHSTLSLKSFFKAKGAESSSVSITSTDATTSTCAPSTSKVTTPIPVAAREETLKAEILWCLKVVEDHLSFHSCQHNSELFQRMFPDSAIAKGFTLSETKCRYMTVFGLGPYVQDLLYDNIKQSNHYVILFDESLNKKLQKKQMDFLIRTWQHNEVCTRYLTSVFIGHGSAVHLKEELNKVLHTVGLEKLLQISMDGPNVNWKMYDDFTREYTADLTKSILNIGSCGLHIVNGAFLTGAKAADWEVESFLSSLYYLFSDSPARREDYQKITGDHTMPLKFCKTRWLENLPVAERAISIWESVCAYVKAVEEKKIPHPKNKSFETVSKCTHITDFLARLYFFISVAKLVNPFLTDYQTDAPMLPFLAEDLTRMLASLMQRFLKLDRSTITSPYKIMQVDVSSEAIQLPLAKLDIGFYTEKKLKDLKAKNIISELKVLEFRTQAKKFLAAMTRKLIERCPLKYALVRNIGCLSPKNMAKDKENSTAKLKRVLNTLSDAHRLKDSCDDILREYSEACDEASRSAEMRDFDPKKERLDSVMCKFLSESRYSTLLKLVRMLLVLSHGQASIERGFSINNEVEEDNLLGHSLISLRAIYDHIKYVGGIKNVTIDKSIMLAASAGRQKYHIYLDEQRRKKEKEKKEGKRKGLMDGLEELKAKQMRLQADVKSLHTSADKYAEEAESQGRLTCISKSNSLRRTAKEKASQLQVIQKQIDEQLNAIKNY